MPPRCSAGRAARAAPAHAAALEARSARGGASSGWAGDAAAAAKPRAGGCEGVPPSSPPETSQSFRGEMRLLAAPGVTPPCAPQMDALGSAWLGAAYCQLFPQD